VHFAPSGEQALKLLADGIEPQLIVILSDTRFSPVTLSGLASAAFRVYDFD
jgi:hypothetical protein